MEYIIRRARKEDLQHVIDLAVSLVHLSSSPFRVADPEAVEKYRRDDLMGLHTSHTNPSVGIFIAEDRQGNFLGHVISMINYVESSTGEPQGYVFDLSVKSGFQGMGIGRNLMKTAEEFCACGGMKYVCLNVTSSNKQAVGFYENIGYEEERKRMIRVIPPVIRNEIRKNENKHEEIVKTAETHQKTAQRGE